MYDNEIYGSSASGISGNNVPPFSRNDMSFSEINQQSAGPSQVVQSSRSSQKNGGIFRKFILSMSMGLFFGIFAGLGFFAVQQGMGMSKEGTQVISEKVPPKELEGQGKDTESGENYALNDNSQNMQVSNTYVVSADVSDVVEDVMPAMVSIINNYTETGSFWGKYYSQDYEASGSGIIVAKSDTELLVVSNYHVVADANRLDVTFINGKDAEAYVKGVDEDMDLAVIAIRLSDLDEDTLNAIHIATLGDSDSLRLGEPVIAIGNALGYGQSVTNGIVSALDREVEFSDGSVGTFIQTNAAINPGNSGGALLNIKGEVIGINCSKYMDVEVEGMGYAIPITSASPVVANLIEKQTKEKVNERDKGYLGIEYEEMSSQMSMMFNIPQGIYVKSVELGSAADKAGIRQGDIITKMDGDLVADREDLQDIMQYYAAGDSATLTVMRPENGEYVSHEIEVVFGSRP